MPRKGYSTITVTTPFLSELEAEAKHHGWSLPQLLRNLLDMKRGLRVPLHHNSHQDAEGIVYDIHYFVEVSRRTFRTLRCGSRAYNKPMGAIVQKFIDQF